MDLDQLDEIAELEDLLKSLKISKTKAGQWARELVKICNIDSVAVLEIAVQKGKLDPVFDSMQCPLKASAEELDFIRNHFISVPPASHRLPLPPSLLASGPSNFSCNGILISNVSPLGGKSESIKANVLKGEYYNTEHKLIECVMKLAQSEVDFNSELRILEELKLAQQSGRQTGCIAMYSSNTTTIPYYLVLEYGGSCISTLLTPSTSTYIIKDVVINLLKAINYLHALNIVHLDIKPENIVCNCDIRNFKVKLIDFDSARHIGEPYPVIDGQLKYTANYACPEVALASDTSVRSNELMDYFSLGLVLWQLLNIRPEPILSTQWSSPAERITLLTDQAALNRKLTFAHGTVYADDIRQMCSLDPSARVGSLDKLMSNSSSQTSLHATNVKLQSEVNVYLQRIDARTTVLHDMSSFMMQQIADTEEVLRRAIFEGTEVKVPTCFVILNQKIVADPSAPDSASSIQAKNSKANTWTDSLSSMFQTAKTKANGGAPNQSVVSTFMQLIGAEKVLYFYLIDEATGLPVVTEDGLYPIEINVVANKSFTSKMLPFLRLSYTAVSAINSVAGLARCLGYPLPPLSSETMQQFKSVVSRIDQQSSIAEFDALQSLATTADEVKQTVRGAFLRELEQFYLQFDPQGQFCGLQRVCLSNGSAAERGAACWTLEPKLLHQAVVLPPFPAPSQVSAANDEQTTLKKERTVSVSPISVSTPSVAAADSSIEVEAQQREVNDDIISCFHGCFLGRKQDFDTIVEHDHQSNFLASAVLAYLYSRGILVKSDETKARHYTERCLPWLQRGEDMYTQGIYGRLMADGVGDIISKNPTAAFKLLTLSATQGFVVAQCWLGYRYESGTGVTQDAAEAVRWYRLAAVHGYAAAQYNLGYCYEYGTGVTKDVTEAVQWYLLAANQGYAAAQKNVGCCYEYGTIVTHDATEAVRWYRLAANQGNAAAQYRLGVCYKKGRGVTPNATEAVRWYRPAAEQGYAAAQFKLGASYEHGRGVTQDATEAVRWYTLAAGQDFGKAQKAILNPSKKFSLLGMFSKK